MHCCAVIIICYYLCIILLRSGKRFGFLKNLPSNRNNFISLTTLAAYRQAIFLVTNLPNKDKRFIFLITFATTLKAILITYQPTEQRQAFFRILLVVTRQATFYPPTCGATASNLQMLCCPSCCRPVANNF